MITVGSKPIRFFFVVSNKLKEIDEQYIVISGTLSKQNYTSVDLKFSIEELPVFYDAKKNDLIYLGGESLFLSTVYISSDRVPIEQLYTYVKRSSKLQNIIYVKKTFLE